MHGATVEDRASLWRSPAMQALVGVTVLGFASYCLTLASLPAYAVARRRPGEHRRHRHRRPAGGHHRRAGRRPGAHRPLRAGPGAGRSGWSRWVRRPRSTPSTTGCCWLSRALGGPRRRASPSSPCSARRWPRRWRRPSGGARRSGIYGLAIAVPNLIAVPAGVALVLDGHAGWLAWLAASPLLGLLLVPTLVRAMPPAGGPGPAGARPDRGDGGARAVGRAVRRHPGRRRAGHVPADRASRRGAGDGGAAAVRPHRGGHALAGRAARGPARQPRGSCRWRSASGRSGWCVVAAGLVAGDAWVLVGAAVFGAGFGAVQNLTLLAAFARAGEGGATAASAMWNASFDAGTAVGALGLGIVAAGIGLPWTYVAGRPPLLVAVRCPRRRSAARRGPTTPDRPRGHARRRSPAGRG